ncbi:9072_t:CDS:1, partial [Dentiscutata erythropus]
DLIFDFTRITNQTNLRRGIESQEKLNNNENNEDNDGENDDGNGSENNGENNGDDNGENNGEKEETENINENKNGLVFDNYYKEGEELSIIQDWD